MKDKNEKYYRGFISFIEDTTDPNVFADFPVDVNTDDCECEGDAEYFKVFFTAAMTDGLPYRLCPRWRASYIVLYFK